MVGKQGWLVKRSNRELKVCELVDVEIWSGVKAMIPLLL